MEDNMSIDLFNNEKFGIGLLKEIFFNAVRSSESEHWLTKNVPTSLSINDFLFTNGNLKLVSRLEEFGKKWLINNQ